MIVAFFLGKLNFYFEIPKITPYHTYPKICTSPFGLHGKLIRAVLSAKTYGVVFYVAFFY